MIGADHLRTASAVEKCRSVGARLGAIAVALLAGNSAAQAGCSPGDLWNALQNAANGLSSGCSAAAADPADWAALAALTGAAGITQVAGAPQFCQAVQSAYATLTNVQGNANSIVQKLSSLGILQNLPASAQQTVTNALNTIGDANGALSTLSCACSVATDQGIGQVAGDISACIQDAICGLQNVLPGFNQCTGSTNVQWVNCTQDPCATKDYYGNCILNPGIGYIANAPGAGGASVQCQSGASGEVCWSVLGADSNGNVTVEACLCPAGMQMNTSYNGGMTDSYGDPIPYLQCTCPSGTRPAGMSGGLSNVCICNNTNQPAQPPGPNGICPTPLTGAPCPSGQVNIGGNCVTPCADPSQVQLANGSCCSPAQASSCGVCCAAGQVPDPATGSCSPAFSPVPRRTFSAP